MRSILAWAGFVIHLLLGALMIFAGSMKLFGAIPPEATQNMLPGIRDNLVLIGAGETLAALLLILPATRSLGVLVTSGFWGGVICIHMAQQESYLVWAIFLVLTWIAGVCRDPGLLGDKITPRSWRGSLPGSTPG